MSARALGRASIETWSAARFRWRHHASARALGRASIETKTTAITKQMTTKSARALGRASIETTAPSVLTLLHDCPPARSAGHPLRLLDKADDDEQKEGSARALGRASIETHGGLPSTAPLLVRPRARPGIH